MACGRSTTWEKIGCAGEVAASTAFEFLECMTGVDVGCVKEVAGEVLGCIGGECVLEIGSECLTFEESFDWDKELFEDKEHIGMNLDGSMTVNVGLELTMDLKQWKFTLKSKSIVTNSLQIDINSSSEQAYQEEKDLM